MSSTSGRIAVLWCAMGLVLAVSGCNQQGFGESVTLTRADRGSVVDDFATGQPLRLPGDAGLNLADSQRSAAGAGKAESSADGTGLARCAASADGVGTATAEFQLGHVLDNRGESALPVTARFDIDYTCRLQTDADDVSKPEDRLALRVFVRDSNKRVHRSMMLTDFTQFTGPREWSGRQSPSFDITMEPGLAYYFVLAGRTSVTGTDATASAAELDVTSMKIELIPRR